MSILRELRVEAQLSIAELSRRANIDRKTVERAERGETVQDFKAATIVATLSKILNRPLSLKDITDLKLR